MDRMKSCDLFGGRDKILRGDGQRIEASEVELREAVPVDLVVLADHMGHQMSCALDEMPWRRKGDYVKGCAPSNRDGNEVLREGGEECSHWGNEFCLEVEVEVEGV